MSRDCSRLDRAAPAPAVTRRDFLQGIALGAGAVLAGCRGSDYSGAAQDLPGYYPPAQTGLRGSHPGSFEAAHALRDGQRPPAAVDTGELFDLVVVGGGISGLTAAYLYLRRVPHARVLVLENHDDFGGHAKRNEFVLGGRLQLMNGGTYSIESPRPYSAIADGLLEQLGIRAAELATRIQKTGYYASLGLAPGTFLDRESFGADHLIRQSSGASWAALLAAAPLPERVRRQIGEIEDAPRDYLPGLTPDEKKARLATTSYRDFLRDAVGAEAQAVAFYQQRTHGLWGVGIDAVAALECWATGLPGFAGMHLPAGSSAGMGPTAAGYADTGGSVDVHLPDGGATIARALVRALVPAALPGAGIAGLVTARVDYGRLDSAGSPARIRLNSTVLSVAHASTEPRDGVRVEYSRDGRAYAVRARHAVLACWNAVIPHICPELPAAQRAALHELVKAPLVYASVAVRNWQAWQRLGIGNVHAPGGYFADISLNECVAIGDYATPLDPAEPMLVRMVRTPCAPGLVEHEQNKAGRAEILATSFERFEHEIRSQLGRTFAAGGFDAARDVLAITVNRWPHGYAPEFNPLFQPSLSEAERPHVRGRAQHGAIAIANSDAASFAYMDAAIEQAYRAVGELLHT